MIPYVQWDVIVSAQFVGLQVTWNGCDTANYWSREQHYTAVFKAVTIAAERSLLKQATWLASAMIASWLDHCHSMPGSLPTLTVEPLWRLQNAAARLNFPLKPTDISLPEVLFNIICYLFVTKFYLNHVRESKLFTIINAQSFSNGISRTNKQKK